MWILRASPHLTSSQTDLIWCADWYTHLQQHDMDVTIKLLCSGTDLNLSLTDRTQSVIIKWCTDMKKNKIKRDETWSPMWWIISLLWKLKENRRIETYVCINNTDCVETVELFVFPFNIIDSWWISILFCLTVQEPVYTSLNRQHNVNVHMMHMMHVTPAEASDPVKRWKMAADKNISIYNDQFSGK